jgi:hypothetical protein
MSRRGPTDMVRTTDHTAANQHADGSEPAPRTRLRAMRDSLSAGVGVALGIAPHVLHHIGLIAGAALVTGAGGNLLFFALGLLFSIPLLRRLHRRFHTWRAPAIALVAFTALFAFSAFVIGPAISGTSAPDRGPSSPTQTQTPTVDHSQHHGG